MSQLNVSSAPTGESTQTPLKILLVAAEVVPFAKTGGLADVSNNVNPSFLCPVQSTEKAFLVQPREEILVVFDKPIMIVPNSIGWIYEDEITLFSHINKIFKVA